MGDNGPERPDDMKPSPAQFDDPKLMQEMRRAAIWAGVIGLVFLAGYLAQTLLVIFGGMVFAAMLDGGARLLGRILPIPRSWRIAIVLLAAALFVGWTVRFAGSQLAEQAAELPKIINDQIASLANMARAYGIPIKITDLRDITSHLTDSLGTLTRAVGGLIGGVTTIILIVVLGIYIAIEPRLYERGIAWMLPERERENFYRTTSRMAHALRRLMAGRLVGMFIEGVFTWLLLALYGVPMAPLLGLLTGLLAFIPNIGAVISGVLIVLVGFSGGTEMGLYTLAVYLAVQNIDGYLVIPTIARKTVDLAPALVLAAQLILGVLFGILGLALADPLIAMLKVALEQRSQRIDEARNSS